MTATASATNASAEVLPAQKGDVRAGKSTAWWGMAVLIMTEATIFASLLASYFYLQAASHEWPLDGIEAPKLPIISFMSVILIGSSGPMFWAEHGIRKGNERQLRAGLIMVILMGLSFFAFLTLYEYPELTFGIRDNAYASIFYTIVGLHALHVFIGLGMNVIVQIKASMGRYDRGRHASAEVFFLYWHFVDVVWLAVFPSLFLSPHFH